MSTAFPMLARCFERQWAGLSDEERGAIEQYDEGPTYLRCDPEPFEELWTAFHPATGTLHLMTVKAL